MNNKPLKYVFFGTPAIAADILERLINGGMPPVAVVANPDAPVGRKAVITPPPVKIVAEKNNIPVLQPKILDEGFLNELRSFDADIFLVMAYGRILPKALLDIPPKGTVNIHPSLLPKYRGASPIQSAILNGDAETGVTLFLLDEKMDHGPMIASEIEGIRPDDNNLSLSDRLAGIGADMALAALPALMADAVLPIPQDDSEATYCRKFTTSDGFIEPQDLEQAENDGGEIARTLDCKIRALFPEPGCWTMRGDKRMKILASRIENSRLVLTCVQFEGKKPIII
jgi:methionyl-tRNA formyltransferase